MKRLKKHGAVIELLPENPEFEPIQVDPREEEFAIECVAVGIVRNGRPC